MKEVLTKSFWLGVKKTFYEARDGPPPENSAAQAPVESKEKPASASEDPASVPTSSEQD